MYNILLHANKANWIVLNWIELRKHVCALVSDLGIHDAVEADWTLKVESTNPPTTILGSAPLWFMAPFLLLRSVIPLPTDTCWLRNAKVLAMIRFIFFEMWAGICLATGFLRSGLKKKKEKKRWPSADTFLLVLGRQSDEWKPVSWTLGKLDWWSFLQQPGV